MTYKEKTTTMKTLTNFAALFALAIALCLTPESAQAQGTRLTLTTASTAITLTATSVTLASSTGVTAQGTLGQYNTVLYIDRELMGVKALVSGTTWSVQRGLQATRPQAHAASATVFLGSPTGNFFSTAQPAEVSGSCTYTAYPTLPLIYLPYGDIIDCLGSKFIRGIRTQTTPFAVAFPEPGATLYTGINTNGTAVGATTLYCTELNMPLSKTLTGLSVLNGTTVTANARYVILYDSAGRALANSALAGQASVTASVYETYAFTTPFYAVGPAQYFGCLQDNATGSTTVRMAVTGQADGYLTKGQTSAVFGTVPVLTVPTTFTTAVGPFMRAY